MKKYKIIGICLVLICFAGCGDSKPASTSSETAALSGTITSIELDIDDTYRYIEKVHVDIYGSIVLDFSWDTFSSYDAREYYVKADIISELIQTAV